MAAYPASLDNIATVTTGQLISSSYENSQNSQTNALNNIESALGLNPSRLLAEGRLTLTSNTPVTTSDVSGASTIYFTPFRGNRIGLFDGSSTWNVLSFSHVSVSLSGLTSGKNYDVFAYNNSGSLAIEVGTAWTDDTTRATDIVLQGGVYVKSGATTCRYLGTFRATGTGTAEDKLTQRFLFKRTKPRSAQRLHAHRMRLLRCRSAECCTCRPLATRSPSAMANHSDSAGGLTLDLMIYKDGSQVGVSARVGLAVDDAGFRRNVHTDFAEQATPGYHYMDMYVLQNSTGTLSWWESILTGVVFQ